MPGQTLSIDSKIKEICVLRLSALGDVCYAVAAIQQIQKFYPSIKITWVVGKTEMQLLHGLKGVEFVVFDKKAGLKGYLELWQALRGRKFDVMLHMQVALRASLASWCIRARRKIGFDYTRAKEGQWLFARNKISAQHHPHVLDGFLGFVSAIGVKPETNLSWNIPVPEEDSLWAKQRLRSHQPYVVICPSASNSERNWHVDRYAKVADHLKAKGFQIVLCGGVDKSELQMAQAIELNTSGKLVNLVGETTLKQLLAVIQGAHLMLSPDTGPAHMAVAMGTPVVGLYAHSNPRRTGPYLYQSYVVSVYEEMIMRQFGKAWDVLPWGTRAKGTQLMSHISTEDVIASVDRALNDFHPELKQA